MAQVGRLDRGRAWVSAPEYDVDGAYLILPKTTFDSSADADGTTQGRPRRSAVTTSMRTLGLIAYPRQAALRAEPRVFVGHTALAVGNLET